MEFNNIPTDLKPFVVDTFKNVYQISVRNLEKSKAFYAIDSLDYLKSVCDDVDKHFAYEYVFADWEKRVDNYIQQNGGIDALKKVWCKQCYGKDAASFEKHFKIEDFKEWARQHYVDTPANIVAENVREALPTNSFYRDFSSFCTLVEKYLCYGDVRHPKHDVLYVGDERLWNMMKTFVAMSKCMASSNRIQRWMFMAQLDRKTKGSY